MARERRFAVFFWIGVTAALILSARQVLFGAPCQGFQPLVVNELVATNGTGIQDEDGNYSDWIEIYNCSSAAVRLADWSLTDNPDRVDKWLFPGVVLGSHEYLVVFASGKDRRGEAPDAALHANFRLNKAGGYLALYNPTSRRFLDAVTVEYPEQFRDLAYGRYGDGAAYGYLAVPTPGGPNDEGKVWEDVAEPVSFSIEHGFYDTPFRLELSTTTPGAAIRYTTDSSEPTETRGSLYTGPITIDRTSVVRAAAFKPALRPSSSSARTYIFLEDVVRQPAYPPGFPPTWGSFPNGDPVVADYEMDPEVVNSPADGALLRDALKAIPSLSLATAPENLDIYSNTEERGVAWERPVSVELIYPDGERPGFQVNAGLRIQGGVGRSKIIPKHSFRLFFKGAYGATKLEYPLFPDSAVEEFDTLVLRGGMNRSYAGKIREPRVDLHLTTYTRDEWVRASQIAMSGVGSHGIFVHLYLNGLYWGLYNVVERPDASFLSSYLGGDKEDWYVVSHSGPVSGSPERFDTLHRLAQAGGLEDPEKYAAVQEYLDVDHFIDYIIVNFFSGNEDWALTNWYAGVQNPDGRVKYFSWDAEWTWIDGAWLYSSPPGGRVIPTEVLLKALMQNPDFRLRFADRIYKHLFNDGALTDASSQARWAEISGPIGLAIVAESARWGDVRYEPPIVRQDWLHAYQDVLDQMEGNAAKWIELTREAGYYPLIDPPDFNRHGGLIAPGFELTMSASEGTIYYTVDGADPRLPVTGAVAPGAQVYRGPLVLTAATRIQARSRAGGIWSALHQATFRVQNSDSLLRVSEIMYNPLGGADYEFLELSNLGDTALDLSHASLEGIRYSFPSGSLLSDGAFVVLVRNPAAFSERYPGVPIGGTYQGKLSNAGETIAIRDAGGRLLTSVSYDDEGGWPISPDGRGDSLVFTGRADDPQAPGNWRASSQLHGAPGSGDGTP
jgi:hypothetical protein